MSNVSSDAGDRSIDRSEGSRRSPKSWRPSAPDAFVHKIVVLAKRIVEVEGLVAEAEEVRLRVCRVGGVRAVSRRVESLGCAGAASPRSGAPRAAARRNSFCFAAVRGRRRLGPGPRVCMGSVASFGARRAPAAFHQELNEKFLTPVRTGADSMRRWRLPSRLSIRLRLPSSSGDETRSSETPSSWTAPGGGHWWFIFVGRRLRPSRPEQGRKGLL